MARDVVAEIRRATRRKFDGNTSFCASGRFQQESTKFPLTFISNQAKTKPIRHVMGWTLAGVEYLKIL